MANEKTLYGVGGFIVGILVGIAVDTMMSTHVNFLSFVIPSLVASLGIGVGIAKVAKSHKPSLGLSLLFGFVCALVAALLVYYLVPSNPAISNPPSSMKVYVTLSQMMPLGDFLTGIINPTSLVYILIGALAGYGLSILFTRSVK